MIAPAARGSRMVDRKTNNRTFEPSHLSPKKPLHSKLIKPHQNEDFRI